MKRKYIMFLVCLVFFTGCAENSASYLKKADTYFIQGAYDYAAYNYIRVLETDRENEGAYLGLIDSYLALGKTDGAEKYIEEVAELFGETNLGNRREALERVKELLSEEAEVAETPEPTEEPEVTEIPEPTEEPEVSEMPEPTEEPEATVTVMVLSITTALRLETGEAEVVPLVFCWNTYILALARAASSIVAPSLNVTV